MFWFKTLRKRNSLLLQLFPFLTCIFKGSLNCQCLGKKQGSHTITTKSLAQCGVNLCGLQTALATV